MGIIAFDQINLPIALPLFHTFFLCDGCFDVIEHFKPHESFDIVFGRERAANALFMFPNTPRKIVRHARIERAMVLRAHNINSTPHRNEHKENIYI